MTEMEEFWNGLWHHQQDGISELRDGYKFIHGPPATRQLFIAPTGAGKTRTAAFIGAGAVARKTPTIFLVDRIALVNQASQAFDDAGVDHGVIRAGHWRRRPDEYLQVCSAQTIEKRGYWPDCELLIVDEAHAIRKGTIEFIESRPEMRVLGLTATPFTKGLGQVYQRGVSTTTTNQLIADGVLVPSIVYAGVTPNMNGAKLANGEFTAADAAKRGMEIVGDIVGEWIQKTREHCGGPAKTIVFSADVEHGAEICRQFQAAGFNFQQISYKDHNDDRREALIKDFSLPWGVGQVQGLVSCEALAKGFDVKDVVVGIFARPYRKSLSAHIQQLGRVMRAAPEKTHALVLCLAEGTPVLTNRGEVPIEQVRLDDLLWDGVEWVSHEGIVCNGEQEVITYAGLTATPGHLVRSGDRWRPFGDCAEEQAPIALTGDGGSAVREREGRVSGPSVAGRKASNASPCGLRVRHLWKAISDLFRQSQAWSHEGLRYLQCAAQNLSGLAVGTNASGSIAMRKSEGLELARVRRAGDRVSIRESKQGGHMGCRELGPAEDAAHGLGSSEQRRALRTGQRSLVDSRLQHAQSKMFCGPEIEASPVQDQTPRSQIRGRNDHSIAEQHDVRADRGPLAGAVPKTKRRVWDILNAGPRNRFTASGLLVHNCHAGNYLRFYKDTMKVFEEGAHLLSDKPLDSFARAEPTDKEKRQIKCSGCGAIMPPRATVCPACGKEKIRISAAVKGEGKMVKIGGKPVEAVGEYAWAADPSSVWRQLVAFGLLRYNGDTEKTRRMAQRNYNTLYGEFARRKVESTEPQNPSQQVQAFASRELQNYARRASFARRG